MAFTETHTSVLIAGAGPSGLMMAAQLLRYGIQPVIIDIKDGTTNQSKALAVQARSLEIYRQMGVIDRILKDGKQAQGVILNENSKKSVTIDLHGAGEGQTAFPFVHLYQQSKNEKLLLDYLTTNCCPVYWQTELVSLKQKANHVEVEIKNGEQITMLTCEWLVGADGAHSIVRKQIQAPFAGSAYAHKFYLADVEVDNKNLDNDYVQLYLGKDGFSGFFPMPGTNRFRIIGNIPEGFEDKEELTVEKMLPHLDNTTGLSVNIKRNYWFTIYRLHHLMAEKFRVQRCFLIGDAAHIHSPVGGQGMNTGLQDAYNLAWKLAGVVNNNLKPGILDSYAAERMPVAKALLNTTDRIFTIVMSQKWYARLFKGWVLPALLNYVKNKKGFRKIAFKLVSQINIHYRHSAINLHLSQSTKIKAGDRLPYVKIYDEKKQEGTDLHAWCSKPCFTLIILGRFEELFLFNITRWITRYYPGQLNFFYLPPSGKNLGVFDALEANPHGQKAVIVRPDMYIGFMNDTVDMLVMDNYLKNVAGLTSA